MECHTVEEGELRLIGAIIRQALVDARVNINMDYYKELETEFNIRNAKNKRRMIAREKQRRKDKKEGADPIKGMVKLYKMSKRRNEHFIKMRMKVPIKESAMDFLFGKYKLEAFLSGFGLQHVLSVDSLRRGFRVILADPKWNGETLTITDNKTTSDDNNEV